MLPPTCCLCAAPGGRDSRGAPLDLCADCRELLPANRAACARCAVPLAGRQMVCAACRAHPPPFDAVFAPYLYAYPVEHMVQALKFQGERVYARLLGQLLAGACCQLARPLPEMLVPIPLHASRYRDRGFNQAQEIARFAAATLGVPWRADVLERLVATREQSGLALAERHRNVRGAFAVCRLPEVASIALVDDVLTTGSTAAAAAQVLKNAGVPRVEIWVAARVQLGRGRDLQRRYTYSSSTPMKITMPT